MAKSVDAADFNWSARGETRGAEPLKLGESARAAPPPIPSQAPLGEGVETRRAAPTAIELRRRDSPDHERLFAGGGESRSGMKICSSKGGAGSSPAVRTNIRKLRIMACHLMMLQARGQMTRRTRSGSHLVLRSEIWHYRCVVPVERKPAFGCSEVVIRSCVTFGTEVRLSFRAAV